jgi:hypothetical protein
MDPVVQRLGQPFPVAVRRARARARHGLVTAWLFLVILVYGAAGIVNLVLLGSEGFRQVLSIGASPWVFPVTALLAFAQVGFAVALLFWQKWAFYAFIASSVIVFLLNLAAGMPVYLACTELLGALVLYGMLQLGTPSAWSQFD